MNVPATEKTTLIARFSNSLVMAMDMLCQQTGENRSELLRRAIRELTARELLDREHRTGSIAR